MSDRKNLDDLIEELRQHGRYVVDPGPILEKEKVEPFARPNTDYSLGAEHSKSPEEPDISDASDGGGE